MPPQLPRVMREIGRHSLSERIAEAIIWSAEDATQLRKTRAAIHPQPRYRDAAWSIMLHLLFEESRDNPVTVDGLAALDELLLGTGPFWADVLEKLGLILQLADPRSGATLLWLEPRAKQVLLEQLLEPTTWNGPVLSQNITVSHLWRLTRFHNCLD